MCADFLIFTNKGDLTSDFIVREMRRRALKFVRINTEDTPLFKVTQKLGRSTTLEVETKKIQLDTVRAAYFRRPLPPEIHGQNLSLSHIQYVREEWSYILRSIYLEINDRWFSHPNKIGLAEDKPQQLRLASELGFYVPETIFTNDLESVKSLFATGDVIAKPFKQALLEGDDDLGSVIFTSDVRSPTSISEESLRYAPVIFQRKINKMMDLRVTIVEDDVFSVAIKSQEFELTKTDWRHSSVANLKHEIFDLPNEISTQCRMLVKRLGLRFGAIDLVQDHSGKFWFLECNPNGQWAWIENRTGLPISAAIVSAMERIAP